MKQDVQNELNKAYEASKNYEFKVEEWMSEEWEKIRQPDKYGKTKDTGVGINILKDIGKKITYLPDDWDFHPQIRKIYELRKKSIQDGKHIDWGTAEALAFATIISEGYHVRLSGQDVERGTFSHRHGVVFHQSKDTRYIPINSIKPHQDIQPFQICNSHLSEYAVLGYEYGYSISNPNVLVLWEAQFGDFANGAQTIIDTFINSGEAKWNVHNGLVMLLPHGYDGQGPEHSNCRIERFLSLVDEKDEVIPMDVADNE